MAGLGSGLQANAAACLAAAAAHAAPGILGAGGPDADGGFHPGLPWIGCTVLAAPGALIQRLRDDAVDDAELTVIAMPRAAQQTNVYLDYLARLAETSSADLDCSAVALLGPKKTVDRLTRGLPLLR